MTGGREDGIARIAMWSGPRNISTAMMRSFENRPDCVVMDEPFYAAFLATSGIHHPMRDEIIAAGEPDWDRVVENVLGVPPPPARILYQKHMTHHMLPGMDRSWILKLSNAFLIRSPERVVASYARKRATVSLRDIGFVEQAEIFDMVAQDLGRAPAVVDADDILSAPKAMLVALCRALDIPFLEEMLSWPAGRRDSDGVWAAHWYGAVECSTGFERPSQEPPALVLDHALQRIVEAARPLYERLRAFRLEPREATAAG